VKIFIETADFAPRKYNLKDFLRGTMKAIQRFAALAFLGLLIPACGGGGGGGGAGAPPPGAFNLLTPAGGAAGVSLTPTFTWENASDELSYTVEIDTDNLFGAPLVYASSPLAADTTSHPVPGATLAGGTAYFWRVRAGNAAGSTTAADAPRSFTTVAAPVDPSFHFAKGLDCAFSLTRSVDAVTKALDVAGNVYVGGRFTTYNDVRSPGILRLDAAGAIDSTFVVGDGFDDSVYAIAAATDGSGDIYVGGDFSTYKGVACNGIVRLNSDGSRDAGFVIGSGFNGTFNNVMAIAIASDGSDVYVGGNFTSYDGTGSVRIARLNSNGTIDAGFVPGTGFNFTVLALAVVPTGINVATDGDLYVGGVFHEYQSTAGRRGLVRLDANGGFDAGFATQTFNNDVNALAMATDGTGDLYVGGAFFNYDTITAGASFERMVRLNMDGTTDMGFDVGTNGFSHPVDSIAVAVDGSNDVYVGGEFSSYNGLAGTGRMVRLNNDGSRDAGFALGLGFAGGLSGHITVRAIAPLAGGDVYAGGYFTLYDTTALDHLARLNGDGTLDASTKLGTGFNYVVRAVLPLADGDVYVGGEFGYYAGGVHNSLVRLNADGSVDAGFATGTGFNAPVLSLALAPDGSGDIYVGGSFSTYKTVACDRVVRLTPVGDKVAGFNPTGTGPSNSVNALLPAADGSNDLFLGGTFTFFDGTACGRFVRVSSAGVVVNAAVGTGFDGNVLGMAFAPDASGDVLVVGEFANCDATESRRIIRLNGDATIDTAAPGVGANNGFNNSALAIAVSGTSVYVGGDFLAYNGVGRVSMARLTGALALDAGFIPTGTGFNDSVRSIVVTGGRVYAAGDFTAFNGTSSNSIAALTSSGANDPAFAVGTGFTRRAYALAFGLDGASDLYVGGEFRSYQNFTVDFLTALDADGTLD
jgi:uncharacterized delta-60 repeat protein